MLFIIPRLRGTDAQGSGAYGAPRKGGRKHKGLDYACRPGTIVRSAIWGEVVRLGYPYAGNRELRLIEIKDRRDSLIRYMYVRPFLKKGDVVIPGTELGLSQRLPYRGIRHHIHVDVKSYPEGGVRRRFVDPGLYFASL